MNRSEIMAITDDGRFGFVFDSCNRIGAFERVEDDEYEVIGWYSADNIADALLNGAPDVNGNPINPVDRWYERCGKPGDDLQARGGDQ